MATVSQEKNLFLIVTNNFLFFEWTVNECDTKSDKVLKSFEFDGGGEKSSYLEMELTRDCYIYLNLYNPIFISGGYYAITISDTNKSVIFNEFTATKNFDKVNRIDLLQNFNKLTSFPVIITCMAKSPNLSMERSHFATSNHLEQLSADLKKYFHQAVNSDTVLILDSENIECHKSILEARSQVFNRMFSHDSSESTDGRVVISDISASAMRKFLDYLYAGTVVDECDFDEILEMYYAADKYEVLSLREDCKKKLLRNIKVDNACSLFVLANRHNDEDFMKEAVKFIRNSFNNIVRTDSFHKLSKDDLKSLMDMYAQAEVN